MEHGNVFNIQRYTVHDGPGIRTEIFLKGCPLSCPWCSNPESQCRTTEPGIYPVRCIGNTVCDACEIACPVEGSILFRGDGTIDCVDRDMCVSCMLCEKACPAGAIKAWGGRMSTEEVMQAIRRDRAYYEESHGGVTLSGGEPLTQYRFAAEILEACKKEGIHTCLETTFFALWRVAKYVTERADFLITDLKLMDVERHWKYTGVSNEQILENIERVVRTYPTKPLVIRIPVVPNVNDDEENAEATASYILEKLDNNIALLQLLPFMHLGEEKSASLNRPYKMKDWQFDEEKRQKRLEEMKTYFEQKGIRCQISGNIEVS